MNNLCVHRHTFKEHPNCFRKKPFYDGLKIGYLDIEASGLSANQAWMLSWAIKEKDGPTVTESVTYDDIFKKPGVVNRNYDYRLTQHLLTKMKEFDVLVTYYGTGFDNPFIRTRAMKYNLAYPHFGDIGHIDLYYHVRSRMSLSRKSLDQATRHLEIAGKTHLDFTYWGLAAMGDEASIKTLVLHNQADVEILEQLHERIEPYCKFIRKSL